MARELPKQPYYRFQRIYLLLATVWATLVSAGIVSARFV